MIVQWQELIFQDISYSYKCQLPLTVRGIIIHESLRMEKMLQLNYDISWIIRPTELQEIPCVLTQAVVNKEEVFKCWGLLKSRWKHWLFLQVSRGLFGAIRCNFKFLLTSNFGIFVFCYQVFKRVQKSFRSNQHSLSILGMCLRWNLVFLLTTTLSNAVIFLVHGATC